MNIQCEQLCSVGTDMLNISQTSIYIKHVLPFTVLAVL